MGLAPRHHRNTGFYYSSPWFAMWRACLLRGRLTARFDELVNIVALWSALRRAAQREARHIDDAAVLARYRQVVFRRLIAGRLQGPMISLQRIERVGRRLVARISRRSMSAAQRRVEAGRREWMVTHHEERKLSREIPDIDPEVLQRGLGFLPRVMREPVASDGSRTSHMVRELCDFELRMRSDNARSNPIPAVFASSMKSELFFSLPRRLTIGPEGSRWTTY